MAPGPSTDMTILRSSGKESYLTPPEQRLGMRPQLQPELQMGLSRDSVGNVLPYLACTVLYVIFCPQFGEKRTSLSSSLMHAMQELVF